LTLAKKTLGKYEIIDRLGRGGMAEVYRAYHASLDRYVAIKLLHPFLADDLEFKDRFEREAQNIAKLRHPHIVQVFDFDFDEVGESYYMVMELIEGRTLKDILFDLASIGQKMPLERILSINIEAAAALSYAHKRNMIHRDVKPANLMIEEPDGRVILTDFGIAKIVTGAQFTASGGMIGTPAYMSPEQGMGESGDERSDLYSLGVILYQMVTGQLPYDADTPLAIILKHLNEPLPDPRLMNPDMPDWLAHVIMKTLAKEPSERYANADEFIAALQAGEQGLLTLLEGDTESVKKTFNSGLPKTGALNQRLMPPGKLDTQTLIADDLRTTQPVMITQPHSARNTWLAVLTPLIIIVGVIAMIGIVLGQGGRGPLAGIFATALPEIADLGSPTFTYTPSPTATFTDTPSPTATFTDTPSPTATFTDTPSPTATFTDTASPTATLTNTPSPTATFTDTPSLTPTNTASPTPSNTSTPTQTPTPDRAATRQAQRDATATATTTAATATAQAQADFFATQRAITPTLDIQRVLENCDLEYVIASPVDLGIPPNANDTRNPRLVASGSEWTLEITIQNTSTCDWPADLIFLSFVENAAEDGMPIPSQGCQENRTFLDENLTDPDLANIRIERAVPQGQQYTLQLFAKAGERFGCYLGVWELRIPDYSLFIGQPFIIGYRAFGGG
jgi:serine/threonine-protein kinase